MATCFLIAPIGNEGSEARSRTDKFEEYILSRALEGLGYEIIRADRIAASGIITKQVVNLLVTADIAVADLTDHNPNVFYEMGIRHATRQPTIHVRHRGTKIPFDNSQMRTFEYEFDIAGAERAAQQLRSAVEASVGLPTSNPFSEATESYLVLRDDVDVKRFRSLDVLDGSAAMADHFSHLFGLAEKGTHYWGQTVGGGAFPANGDALVRAALEKGASVSLIVTDNPPNSNRIIDIMKKVGASSNLKIVSAEESNLRFFGMGTAEMLFAIRIDGRYNAIIIRDYNFIKFFLNWFSARLSLLAKGGNAVDLSR